MLWIIGGIIIKYPKDKNKGEKIESGIAVNKHTLGPGRVCTKCKTKIPKSKMWTLCPVVNPSAPKVPS